MAKKNKDSVRKGEKMAQGHNKASPAEQSGWTGLEELEQFLIQAAVSGVAFGQAVP